MAIPLDFKNNHHEETDLSDANNGVKCRLHGSRPNLGDSPYGPFTYQGTFMDPVEGWTTHHSILEIKGKWYIFYHDTQLSGKTHLRNIKVTELTHRSDGMIDLIAPIRK